MLLFSLTLLQASVACLVTGPLLWALLSLAQRRWPALAAQRSVWLVAQLVLAAVFVLPLLPDTRQLSVVPELSVPVSLAGAAPDVQLAMAGPAAGLPPTASWLALVPSAWGLIYLLGVACAAWRWQRGHAMLRSLLQLAQRRRLHGMDVLEVAAPISPMLVGVWRPRLLLPAHLAQFTPEQQQLVIAHELTHARRRDPVLLLLANMLQALLWFNPAARWLAGQLAWAQELGCDRQVLAGRPPRQRQQYAAALVRQLGLQAQPLPGLAFGGGGMAERLLRMRDGQARPSTALRVLTALLLCAIGAASLALQPALAWAVAAAPASMLAAPATAPALLRNPLDSMRVTGFFGVVRELTPQGHRGIDLGARRGTPVHAAADGIASVSEDARLGKAVRIDHGAGVASLYAHLDRVTLTTGMAVTAGQAIGTVGATGLATGPHLHFEVTRDGRLQDPRQWLAGLDANATARALRMRKEQFGH
ncbi:MULTISPECIES: M23/M56 family metallopeptidase [Janthinobacterium]|uniref:M23/M56 family metallopeptidase n=1 Tax=Janthinobacterium rivuli TaxID=2751478 RepID=A0ABY8I9B6_9BURK|nr:MULTISPECIES: M23/M56 family metallopeptidase [Janthinobacterium]NVI83404.1 peptidoglycan DD-metalloendopeptidase family protein [Janthinobacterium sp. BJB401]WFR81536.1 M23/M56 family metallopeptidase [Janthinobacterium rivuli]